MKGFARVCDATNEGMNEGYCFGDGEAYFKHEADALNYAKSIGYVTLDEAYNNEAYYYTEWEELDEEEEDMNILSQKALFMEIVKTSKINIVTCGNCGKVVLHFLGATTLTCPHCQLNDEVSSFPDLY